MDQFDLISEQFNILHGQSEELNAEYEGKTKGELYNSRMYQLIDKMNALKKKALKLGSGIPIIKFDGIIIRPHKKNPKIAVEAPFILYLAGLTSQEAIKVLEMRYKNIKTYKMETITSGTLYDK